MMQNNVMFLLAVLAVFVSFSCDNAMKFENPMDENNRTAAEQGELGGECYPNGTCSESLICDTESNTCTKTGLLGGECYPNGTCNKGLICDEERNLCIKDQNGNEPADTGDTTQTDTGDTTEPTDTGDTTEPTDTGDTTEPTDTGDPEPCTDCDGSGVKITGTVTLFHPSALPSSTYSGLGGVQDGSEYFPPCETSVTLGEKSVYGSLVVNLNTKHVATVAEMDALNGITGTENFIQVNHSVSGDMGSAAFPKYSTGITMSYFKLYTNTETGVTETNLFFDDMDLISGNIADTYAIRIICEVGTISSGVKKIGPYNGDDCVFWVLNFGTDSSDACWHAIGVSDPDLVNDGLTFTVQ